MGPNEIDNSIRQNTIFLKFLFKFCLNKPTVTQLLYFPCNPSLVLLHREFLSKFISPLTYSKYEYLYNFFLLLFYYLFIFNSSIYLNVVYLELKNKKMLKIFFSIDLKHNKTILPYGVCVGSNLCYCCVCIGTHMFI